jgi:hypothetical protein
MQARSREVDPVISPIVNGKDVWHRWIFGQPAYIVLLFAILGAVGYGAWYGFPAAIEKIQSGYERIESQHAAERKEVRDDNREDRTEMREALKSNTEALGKLYEKMGTVK